MRCHSSARGPINQNTAVADSMRIAEFADAEAVVWMVRKLHNWLAAK